MELKSRFYAGSVVVQQPLIRGVLGLFGGLGDSLYNLISFVTNLLLTPIGVLTLMWFAAMVTEDCGPFEAFPKAFNAMIKRFWSVLGISLLLSFGYAIIAGILAVILVLMKSYVLAGLVFFILGAIYSVLVLIYSFEVYRGETYKDDLLAVDPDYTINDNPGDYL
ncbi:MAG: hypothetical protein BWY74_02111 [Firmicutes bacterium ADurb.Bin419]|nr:MAG: hypothetical protein BWY74_02111 [Firmicutes bacterium ADurb.Bin419]